MSLCDEEAKWIIYSNFDSTKSLRSIQGYLPRVGCLSIEGFPPKYFVRLL